MRIGITGSAGFLGANLVRILYRNRSAQDELLCFYSRRRHNPLTDDLDLNYEHLDITSRQEVLHKTRGLDLLFHLAGAVDYSRKNARRTWDVNVLGTKNIFDATLQNRIRNLVYASSINVLGSLGRESEPEEGTEPVYATADHLICFTDRADTLAAVDASIGGEYGFLQRSRISYFDSKLAGYELAVRYHREFGLPVTLVLPGTAVGPGDVGVSISRLVMQIFEGKLRLTLPGGTSFVSADDAAEGIRLAAIRGQPGQAYIITGRREDNLSYRDFMKLVAEVARTRYHRPVSGRFLTVPRLLCRPLAAIFRLLPMEGRLSEALILSGSVTHRFDGSKAADRLGYRPRTSLQNAIAGCIDFYHQHTQGDS